jgi:hypothetical protein
MKRVLLLLLGLLFLSFNQEPFNDAREFHVKIVGEPAVEKFEREFPNLTSDRTVYISYLGKYYIGHEDAYIRLLY